MMFTDSPSVYEHPSNPFGHAPTNSSPPEPPSPTGHVQEKFLYLAATCLCLLLAYVLDSRRRSSKSGSKTTHDEAFRKKENKQILVDPGEWLRPLGSLETFAEVGGEYGSLNVVEAIWISSKQPIDPVEVRKAILKIAEKTHILQVSVEWRTMRPWFKRMREIPCDFEVEEDDAMSVFYTQLQTPYDLSNGPLWRARLVPIPQKSSYDPHEACLMISAHHCIMDGHTSLQIFRDTLELLNSSMTGRAYEVPMRPVIPAISDTLMTERDWFYLLSYFGVKAYRTLLTCYSSKVYFDGALTRPETKIALTKVFRKNYTLEETKKIIQYCKEAGVTVHSCIMAIANLALLRTGQQLSKRKIDAAEINTMNCVNMRRYLPEDLKDCAGCHISLEEKELLIPSSAADSKESFWALAKVFQDNLNDSLNVDRTPVKNAPLLRLATIILPINYELTRRGRKNITDNHITSTNMGNLKHLLPAKYDGPVEITDLLRSSSNEFNGNPFTIAFHTFNNRFMISLTYYTNKIHTEEAAHYFSNLNQYISNLTQYGSVQPPASTINGFTVPKSEEKCTSEINGSYTSKLQNGVKPMPDCP